MKIRESDRTEVCAARAVCASAAAAVGIAIHPSLLAQAFIIEAMKLMLKVDDRRAEELADGIIVCCFADEGERRLNGSSNLLFSAAFGGLKTDPTLGARIRARSGLFDSAAPLAIDNRVSQDLKVRHGP